MNKKKIFNDPVHGMITIPFEIIFDIIEHPWFQRLRRISQLGLTHYIFPGAMHTRFHHALGAMHLMVLTIQVLRDKGVSISEKEARGVCMAILLHDIGHSPFSHTLENVLIPMSHEDISLRLIKHLNDQADGELDMAIEIFTGKYKKKFLHQLVSGQLDMDRLDYLARDSFYTGVMEGRIGYDRIIKMLHVVNDELVIEEKGIYSIEKFLVARKLMYLQVYLHRAVLSAEIMLKAIFKYVREDYNNNVFKNHIPPKFTAILEQDPKNFDPIVFTKIDDVDVMHFVKQLNGKSFHVIYNILSLGIINRKLFKVELQQSPFSKKQKEMVYEKIKTSYRFSDPVIERLIYSGKESTSMYDDQRDEIKILKKNGAVTPLSQYKEYEINTEEITRYYLCYPK